MADRKKKNRFFWTLSCVLVGLSVLLFFIFAGPHLWFGVKRVFNTAFKIETPSPLHHISDAWDSVQHTVNELYRAETENRKLKLEIANLRFKLEDRNFRARLEKSFKNTRQLGSKLQEETGSLIGRTIEQIEYRPPKNLLPQQLYTLGVSYFKAHEDEKAAVIFTLLTGLKDNDAYQNPKDLIMTGISWYRLDHFKLADAYFEKILQFKESPENLPYHAQARLWKALVAHRMKKPVKAQYWLLDLVDHHPRAPETAWVNMPKEHHGH
ncbi:MAG: hypothetical protein HY072_07345 [Deltaproteobacteria bacterium]|nr:hypothetical protein [Deltaproteobacteria bacterium]